MLLEAEGEKGGARAGPAKYMNPSSCGILWIGGMGPRVGVA